ncbi:hypothetical protein E4T49_04545 [Aureobasidium sp. EXF-10728]|nr:hypothetical protein E4T49_04545 [Aureobasidium sp. EXF-10728]
MSRQSEAIRLLEAQLSPSNNIHWIVYEQPVVALFSKTGNPTYTEFDREHLGHPSIDSSGLKLWIAHDDEASKLLVVLTQEIRMVSRRQPRIFYMTVPVESLGFETSGPASWAMSDGVVPLHVVDEPKATANTLQLVRTSLSLAAKSSVLMPSFPYSGRVSPEAMSLICKLKILSEASCFDLFVPHSPSALHGLLRVKDILGKSTVSGFNVNHTNFYSKGRHAVIDAWESQGWCSQDEEARERSAQGSKRKHDEISGGGSLPPPYRRESVPGAAAGSAPEITPGVITPGVTSTASFDMALILYEEVCDSAQESGHESPLSGVYPRGRSISPPMAVATPKPPSPNFEFTSPLAPAKPPPSYDISINPTAAGHRTVLVKWLAVLLRLYPDMYFTCARELLALGMAARAGDARAVRAARAKCMATIICHQTETKISPLRSNVEDLVGWLLVLDPEGGDLAFLTQITEMAKGCERGLGPTPRSSDGALFDEPGSASPRGSDVAFCKAAIIIDAAMKYGPVWKEKSGLLKVLMDVELKYR